jgi:hypothetical protein
MSGGPKKSEFAAGAAEKALASVSLAEKNFFRENYLPKLTQLRDRTNVENYESVATGRAQADTMQALSGRPSLAATRSVNMSADMASAAGAQALQGRYQGLAAKRGDQVNVLKNARGMQADAQQGLSQAARIATTKQLDLARARQQRRSANIGMVADIFDTVGTKLGQTSGNNTGT